MALVAAAYLCSQCLYFNMTARQLNAGHRFPLLFINMSLCAMNTQNTFLDRCMYHYHNAAVFLDGLSKNLFALSKSYKMSHMLYSVILHINHVFLLT